MINWIGSWVQGIVIAVVISTIIEMILPDGNIKKYVRTVIGVYIVFVIISPIITKITGKEINLKTYELPKTTIVQQNVIDTNAYIERSIVKFDQKTVEKKIERWQKISEVASKQSGRDIIPKIEIPTNIKKICENINEYDIVLVAYENEEDNTLKTELQKIKRTDNLKIAIIIGPEGGIDKKEILQLKEVGARTITLGQRILRTETASIVVISNIIYELEM